MEKLYALILVVFASVVLQLSSADIGFSAAAPSRLVIGYASTTPRLMPLWVARDQGFFAKYSIESEPVLSTGRRDPCHRNGFGGHPNRAHGRRRGIVRSGGGP